MRLTLVVGNSEARTLNAPIEMALELSAHRKFKAYSILEQIQLHQSEMDYGASSKRELVEKSRLVIILPQRKLDHPTSPE